MKKFFVLLTLVLASVSMNAASNVNLIHIQQPANSKANIISLNASEVISNKAASPVLEVVNYGNACSVLKGYSCPFVAQYDKNMYKAEFKCTDPKAGKMVKYTTIDGAEEEVFMVTPTKECTVTLVLTYSPKKVSLGDKKVSYSEKTVDATGDGKILVNGTALEFNGAKVNGGLKSPYDDTYMVATNKNTISGDINTNGELHVMAESEFASVNASLSINGGIHCNGVATDDMGLMISGTEVYACSQGYQPVISGFTSFSIDEDKYMMIEPLGGRYDTEKRMLVDAHGKPATSFIVINRDRYEIDDHEYNINIDEYLTDINNYNAANEVSQEDGKTL